MFKLFYSNVQFGQTFGLEMQQKEGTLRFAAACFLCLLFSHNDFLCPSDCFGSLFVMELAGMKLVALDLHQPV